MNDVAIGQDEPVRSEDHARPAGLVAFDAHDGGRDGFDRRDHGARVGIEERVVSVMERIWGHAFIKAPGRNRRIARMGRCQRETTRPGG